jgi:hypothetical protein
MAIGRTKGGFKLDIWYGTMTGGQIIAPGSKLAPYQGSVNFLYMFIAKFFSKTTRAKA